MPTDQHLDTVGLLKAKVEGEIARLEPSIADRENYDDTRVRLHVKAEALRWVLREIEALPPVGVGWKMVPVEPTEAMLANTVDERKLPRILDFTTPDERDKPFLMPRFMYRAMIAASPQSPGEEKGMGHATARHPPVIAPNRTPTIPPAPALIAGLEIAKTALEAAPHGDNCFLHSGGGYYDRCFCGKDSVVAHLDGLLHAEAAEQTDPPQIDEAREIVRRALHAADNGNHAGEQAILRMASPNQNGGLSSATDDRERGVHMAHCNQGLYAGSCKYGEQETCPALNLPVEPGQ